MKLRYQFIWTITVLILLVLVAGGCPKKVVAYDTNESEQYQRLLRIYEDRFRVQRELNQSIWLPDPNDDPNTVRIKQVLGRKSVSEWLVDLEKRIEKLEVSGLQLDLVDDYIHLVPVK